MTGELRELKKKEKEKDNFFLNRVPPQNIEAEQSILGSILIDNSNIYQVVEVLDPDDFYRDSHIKIYRAVLDLFERGTAIDLITLSEELKKRGQLDEIGGPAYISQLTDTVPAAINVSHYAKIVREKSVLRMLINISLGIASKGLEDVKDVDSFLDDAEREIFKISEQRIKKAYFELKSVTPDVLNIIMKRMKNKNFVTGVPTGFKDLDNLTSGFQPSNFVIIASRPSVGKTALGVNIAINAALRNNIPVGFFTIEMSKEEIVKRMLCVQAKIDSQKLISGYLSEKEANELVMSSKELEKAPIYIDDTSDINVLELRAKARRLKAEHNVGIIFVDYLQLIQGPKNVDTREQEISHISRSLKALSKELNIPVVAMAQLSRQVEKNPNKRPRLADLRESGAIEQDADLIAFLYRDESKETQEQPAVLTEVIIGKNRNGPTDIVKLVFLKKYTRFEDHTGKI